MQQFIDDLVSQIKEYMDEYGYKTYCLSDIKEFAIFYMEEGEENYDDKTLNKIVKAVSEKVNGR